MRGFIVLGFVLLVLVGFSAELFAAIPWSEYRTDDEADRPGGGGEQVLYLLVIGAVLVIGSGVPLGKEDY